MRRKEIFKDGELYHILNRSISGFNILKDINNCWRFLELLDYYNNRLVDCSFSRFLKENNKYQYENLLIPKEFPFVKFICFSLMPTHYHLLLKILDENNFSYYISNVENSFSRFFNIKFKRKGPLWESRFRAVRIKSEEQLLHVSRYIHLNPVTDYLIEKAEDWKFSSYRDFINKKGFLNEIISEVSIKNPKTYQQFVENQKDYQRKLKMIKKTILE
ncbi:transposase [Candidatus Roizmanbacteria bacterium]|nr:transposase [Candidatus Roizmanbacteria bacterium]